MARKPSLYPPSPSNVPEDLTVPQPQYRSRVVLVLFCVIIFFLIYLTLLFGTAFLIYWSLASPVGPGDGGVVIFTKFLFPILGGLLFLFLLKGFFKGRNAEKTFDIEIFEKDHPRLFDFIDQLCVETNAPFPHRVFVNFEVNACASYDATVFSLFMPTPKNLTIGLGLVNILNLSEFKSVLAHEFGHFSQSSMKLGTYVYVAGRICNDMVFGRDWFDEFLDRWRSLDIRVSFLAWAFTGVLWALRQVLGGLFYAIFYFERALSREMEFHADLVAVSVVGSDAPVHVLSRLVFADSVLEETVRELSVAADHKLYTADMFYHFNHAMSYLRRVKNDPNLGEPPALPADATKTTKIFKKDDYVVPHMWDTHPPNYDREKNCKADYIRTQFDERSPWLLFDDVDRLREHATYKFYRICFRVPKKDLEVCEAKDIQAFIDDERAETTYDPKYCGLYDRRDLELKAVYKLADEIDEAPWPSESLPEVHANLYSIEVKHRAQIHNKRLDEFGLLFNVSHGYFELKDNELEFREEFYDARDAKRLLKKVDKELSEDQKWLKDLDRRVFQVHYQMAMECDKKAARELVDRYYFHVKLQKIWRDLKGQEAPVNSALAYLEGRRQVEYNAFREALDIFRTAQEVLADGLDAAKDMPIPALKNLQAGEPLRKFLLEGKLVRALDDHEEQLKGKWIGKLLGQIGEVQKKINRIHFKSLGNILAVQEKIAQKYLGAANPAPQTATKTKLNTAPVSETEPPA